MRDVHPTRTVLDWLREDERAVGTKEGCYEGDCGACTVVLRKVRDGRLVLEPVNACIQLLGQLDGSELLAVEDLASHGNLHPVQEAMVRHHGSQCGFCTPGIVMSLFALYENGNRPVTRAMVNDQLAGNLCRCTGYRPIVDAALAACAEPAAQHSFGVSTPKARLEALADDADVFVSSDHGFFAAPASIESLARLYAQHPTATLVAGNTDVGLWINKQMRQLNQIIWLGKVKELDHIVDDTDALLLGAGVSHASALPHLARIDPDLGELGRRFGSVQVRTSGTIGGNIANGSPIGDWAPAFIALGAELDLVRFDGSGTLATRRIPLDTFFLAYGRQDRQQGEIVRALRLPKPGAGTHFRCFKLSKRIDEDISAVMGAFMVQVEGAVIRAARVAFGGMAGTPCRAPATEAALVGLRLDQPAGWQVAVDALGQDYRPLSDHRASAGYRTQTAQALLVKALTELGDPTAVTRLVPRAQAEVQANAA
jgi:xanthine dehydrogenase small subunit